MSETTLMPRTGPLNMCWYEQYGYKCSDFRWGLCRERCDRHGRPGQPCTQRLVLKTISMEQLCKACNKIENLWAQHRRRASLVTKWRAEDPTCPKADDAALLLPVLRKEIQELEQRIALSRRTLKDWCVPLVGSRRRHADVEECGVMPWTRYSGPAHLVATSSMRDGAVA